MAEDHVDPDRDPDEPIITKQEAFIRLLVARAFAGSKEAIDLVAAYIAGKPGKQADKSPNDNTAEELLDKAGVAELNTLLKPEGDTNV